MGNNKPGRLGQRITATRNALVHLPAAPRDVLDGRDLIEAVELLGLVLNANLLLDLGLGPCARGQPTDRLLQPAAALAAPAARRNCSWPKSNSPFMA